MRIKKDTVHTNYLVGTFEDNEFWSAFETQDEEQAIRYAKINQEDELAKSRKWGVVKSTITFSPIFIVE